jgi:hypothetical protein
MIEQFTGYHGGTNAYYPNLKKFDLVGALQFENDRGLVLRWNSLPDNDPRRYRIVEMALQCAWARVPYDDQHGQLASTMVGESLRRMAGGVGLKLDCIAFCHFAYWKGAKIDLDVSMMPFHAPVQLYDHAKKNQLWRPTSFKPLVWDAAYLGTWKPVKINVQTSGMSSDEAAHARSELGYVPAGTRFQVRRPASDFTFEMSEWRDGKAQGSPMQLKLDRQAQSPINAGWASFSLSQDGGTMTQNFVPSSDSTAKYRTVMVFGGKRVTAVMDLVRERAVRKLPR